MPTLSQLRSQIAEFPYPYSLWTRQIWVEKEIQMLPKIFDPGETLKALTSGAQNGAIWLGVCTERRIFFLHCGLVFGTKQVQMPLDRIQSIDHTASLFFGTLSVFDGVNVFSIDTVRKASILPFVKAAEEAMFVLRHGQPQPAPAAAAAKPADVASQLAKLAELKEKGYLTDAEFAVQKKKLLG